MSSDKDQDRPAAPAASEETLPPSLPARAPSGPPLEQGTLPPSISPEPAASNIGMEETQSGGSVTAIPGEESRAAQAARDASGAFPVLRWERYEFLGLLGRGGMGAVYKARDRRLGRVVALKFILGADPNLVMRFLQEARAQARIDHPNVCKVYEVGEVDGRAYIAMQFVDGERLDRAAANMSQGEKVRVMRDVALAMHEAHKLGIVHRDLKPANILVERGDDGRWFPVVMDFGLAREATADHNLTESGALLGTPSYMAPEQARGDVRNIDRRSDVYSLGATLYELLAGKPPFQHPALAEALNMVLNEEPPSLRGQVPQLPVDLETISLKCLAKEPDRRYASARALAEDLGRYLDGEPILGRRPSLMYRLRLRARRNRSLVWVSAISMLLILGLSGLGVRAAVVARRERARAAERAQLAARLGQDVKEIEWFLRSVYQLPLHDTRPEQAIIRGRMKRIASEQHGLGAAGEAQVQYALSRGHLALYEFEEAAAALEKARAAGLDSPELHYARGRVLGEQYLRAVEELRRSGDKAWREAQEKILEQRYLVPAREALERSRAGGLVLESPQYLEALISLYRRDYAAAEKQASEAVGRAPWLYEARALAADAALQAGVAELDRGGLDVARAALDRATRIYADAAEVARSDAHVHLATVEAWLQRAAADRSQGKPQREAVAAALAAADRAQRAAPDWSPAYREKAFALLRWYRAPDVRASIKDMRPVLEEFEAVAARAVELDARDGQAWDALGNARYFRGGFEMRRGGAPEPWWDKAISAYSRSLDIEPNHPWANNDLGLVYQARGGYHQDRGEDPRPAYREAIRYFQRAAELDPQYLFVHVNTVELNGTIADYEISVGVDPTASVEAARRAAQRCLEINPNFYTALDSMARIELILAEYLEVTGKDPRPALAQAKERLDRSQKHNPNNMVQHFYRAVAARTLAIHAMHTDGDPSLVEGALAEARRELEAAQQLVPKCPTCWTEQARVAMLAAELAERRGGKAEPVLLQALADTQRVIEFNEKSAYAHMEQARVHLALAGQRRGKPAGEAIAAGLARVDRALALHPRLARAHAVRGALLLRRARDIAVAEERRADLDNARTSLLKAFEINPLHRREYGGTLKEVEALIGGGEGGGAAK